MVRAARNSFTHINRIPPEDPSFIRDHRGMGNQSVTSAPCAEGGKRFSSRAQRCGHSWNAGSRPNPHLPSS